MGIRLSGMERLQDQVPLDSGAEGEVKGEGGAEDEAEGSKARGGYMTLPRG